MPTPDKLPWKPWYLADWRSSRRVLRMTLAERGLYHELLDECWDKGSIPAEFEALADIANCTHAEIEAAWPALVSSFVRQPDGRYMNEKTAAVRAEQEALHERRVNAGRKGGKKKAAKRGKPVAPPSPAVAPLGNALAPLGNATGSSNALAMPSIRAEEKLLLTTTAGAPHVAAPPTANGHDTAAPPVNSSDRIVPNGPRLDRVDDTAAKAVLDELAARRSKNTAVRESAR